MHSLIRITLTALFCLVLVAPASAQQVVTVNSASYSSPDLPNGSIAQGSMFIGFGTNLGPSSIEFPTPWPFPTELAGTSIQVTVGGQTVDCFMVYTVASQVAGILPSDTPLGAGTLTVMYNGSVAATGAITVVEHSFGIFALNQQGSGPVVATDPLAGDAVYTILNSAVPGGFIDIWGTGLGAVTFPDEGQTQVIALGYDVKVYVAGELAEVVYAGRSGCCSAIDLIRVKAPTGVKGCFLPVTVVVEGVVSNYTTISIDAEGGTCSIDPLFGELNISQLVNEGTLRIGSVNLVRFRTAFDIPSGVAQVQELVQDSANASYEQITIQNVNAFAGILPVTTIGACTVYQFSGEDQDYPDLYTSTPLDAGSQLAITGPGGDDVIPRLGNGYSKNFSFPEFSFLTPEVKEQFSFPTYYEPGLTTVTAPGGADVQGHMASITVPQDLVWTNKEIAVGPVSRSSPLTLQYQAAGYDFLSIFGFAPAIVDPGNIVGAGFICIANPSVGFFTIPAQVLMSMPDTPLVEGVGSGGISIIGTKTNSFDAVGTDVNTINYTDQTWQFGTDFN